MRSSLCGPARSWARRARRPPPRVARPRREPVRARSRRGPARRSRAACRAGRPGATGPRSCSRPSSRSAGDPALARDDRLARSRARPAPRAAGSACAASPPIRPMSREPSASGMRAARAGRPPQEDRRALRAELLARCARTRRSASRPARAPWRRPRSAPAGTPPRRGGGRSRGLLPSARDRGRDHRQQRVKLGPGGARRRLDREHPDRPPAISGSKRTEDMPRSAASSAGMRSSSWASRISTGRRSSSAAQRPASARAACSAHSARQLVELRTGCRPPGRDGLRGASYSHAITRSASTPRGPRGTAAGPIRRPPAARQLACPQIRTPWPPAPVARSYLHTRARGRPASFRRLAHFGRQAGPGGRSGGRAVLARPRPGPPRYSGRFLIPSRVDHLE